MSEEEKEEEILTAIGRLSIEESTKKGLHKLPANFYRLVEKGEEKLINSLKQPDIVYVVKLKEINRLNESKKRLRSLIDARMKKIAIMATLYATHPSPNETTNIENLLPPEKQIYENMKKLLYQFIEKNASLIVTNNEEPEKSLLKIDSIPDEKTEEEILVKVNVDIGEISWLNNRKFYLTKEDILYLPVTIAKLLEEDNKVTVINKVNA